MIKKAKLCYVDTDSFIVFIKPDEKVIALMRNELGGKIMTKLLH